MRVSRRKLVMLSNPVNWRTGRDNVLIGASRLQVSRQQGCWHVLETVKFGESP
jgi:hypothetical protein